MSSITTGYDEPCLCHDCYMDEMSEMYGDCYECLRLDERCPDCENAMMMEYNNEANDEIDLNKQS